MIYGGCAPELKRVAVKVLCQTTSATNCERNWSTFSYIHTKSRNKLKYKKLQKLVFTQYNMKLKMRHQMRRSQEEIEESFNPINLDYIFEESDALSPWIEERENPLLDGLQNSSWLPLMDTDDEDMEGRNDDDDDGDGDDGDDGDGDDGNVGFGDPNNDGNDDTASEIQTDFQPTRRYRSLIDMTTDHPSLCESSGTGSNRRRGNRHHNVPLDDASYSSVGTNFGYSGNDESSSSTHYYVPFDQYPNVTSYDQYGNDQASSYYQPSTYQDPYYQETSGGLYDYVFIQGYYQDDGQSESRGCDPPRHSTMW
ncbi:unnamed protein product [Cuscuta epithymum]|nr:unnamed protein product [Cuscuta epithymum]